MNKRVTHSGIVVAGEVYFHFALFPFIGELVDAYKSFKGDKLIDVYSDAGALICHGLAPFDFGADVMLFICQPKRRFLRKAVAAYLASDIVTTPAEAAAYYRSLNAKDSKVTSKLGGKE